MTDKPDKPDAAPPIKELTFEAAMAELERIVGRLEQGDVPLAESIAIYERGEALKAHCDKLLKAAETKVEKIQLAADGTPSGTGDAELD